jgi:diguanylate cyclase (GGDEF)-like protein
MSNELSEHAAAVLEDHLPSLPGVAVALLELCDSPTAGILDVAEVASYDPALVARILQVANSSFYALPEPVTDLNRAAVVLGMRNLKMVALGFAVVGSLWQGLDPEGPVPNLLGGSMLAGSAARASAGKRSADRNEEAFAAGLLSYVGELALSQRFGNQMTELWAEHHGLPSAGAQRAVFGTDGVMIGQGMMQRWGLPDGLQTGLVARSLDPIHRVAGQRDRYLAALSLGTAVADVLLVPDPSGPLRATLSAAGLDDSDMLGYLSEFRLAVRATSRMLGVDQVYKLDHIIAETRQSLLLDALADSAELRSTQLELVELKEENERLSHLSYHDALTGLPNRLAYDNFLEAHLYDHVRRPGKERLGLIVFDLDGFKLINDELGHQAGDAVLRAVAVAVAKGSRVDECFARLGGDEFALVLPRIDEKSLRKASERIRHAVEHAKAIPRLPRPVTASVGAAMLTAVVGEAAADAAALYERADRALYEAKRRGGNACALAPLAA